MTAFSILADLVVLIHGAFVLFALLGGLLVLKRHIWAWLHLPVVLWAAIIELTGWICPLTPLENRLRALGGESGYGGDFVGQYLLPLIYPDDLTRGTQIVLGLAVLLFNGGIYAWILLRRKTATP